MIHYRLATPDDNQQLLALTSSTGMSGNIGLRIDRFPDFFSLNQLRGETSVHVAVEDNLIIGCISVSRQQVYVDKRQYDLYYVSDLKVTQSHRGQGVGLQLTKEVVNFLESQSADLTFLNVSKGNERPFVFLSDSSYYPDFVNIGTFNILQFIGSNKQSSNAKFKIVSTEANGEILAFLNEYYSNYQLASIITQDKIQGTQLFEVRQEGKLIAVMCLIDTMEMKQNVVTKMAWHLKYLVALINSIRKIFKISKLPKENEAVTTLYIKYLAVKQYDKTLVSALISHSRQCAYQKSYSFVSLGLHELDPLIKNLPNTLKFTFNSIGMLVSLKSNKTLMESVLKGIPFKDYSIV